MFKLKRNTIKIIIGTSFIWFAVDVVFLISYLGCKNSYCSLDEWGEWGPNLSDSDSEELISKDNISYEVSNFTGDIPIVYRKDQVCRTSEKYYYSKDYS